MKRLDAMMGWAIRKPAERAEWFRAFARHKITEHRQDMVEAGLHAPNWPLLYPVEEQAIDAFADIAIEQDRDDDDAIAATLELTHNLHGALSGIIPNAILFHHGCGSRARATLLREAWTAGHSGSVLALNGPKWTTLVEYFNEVDREQLMDGDERAMIASLPAVVTLYRGAKSKADLKATARALSWTRDLKTAEWFAQHGYGDGKPIVLQAEYPAEAILAIWETSGREPEVIVNPKRCGRLRLLLELLAA